MHLSSLYRFPSNRPLAKRCSNARVTRWVWSVIGAGWWLRPAQVAFLPSVLYQQWRFYRRTGTAKPRCG